MRAMTTPRVSGALMVACALLAAPAVSACGGFFCSQVPVEQSGEHILFSVEGKAITAHIQIQYSGPAEKFSWVLPLPEAPSDLAVGTDTLFSALRAQTDPRFEIKWEFDEGCGSENNCEFAAAGGDPSANDDGGGSVTVIASGEVGPFTFEIVKAEEGAGDELFTWLKNNNYDQPPEAEGLVKHYVNQDYVFVGLKLQKGKEAGDLQPIVVKYESELLACVPLKLTAIAASENMPVRSWILAKARAVPINYFHAILNAKAYDWLSCAVNANYGWWGGGNGACSDAYNKLVGDAADEANGHAFVTEFAGKSDIMDEQVYREGQFDLKQLESKTTPGQFLQEMTSQGFPRGPLVQQLIRAAIGG